MLDDQSTEFFRLGGGGYQATDGVEGYINHDNACSPVLPHRLCDLHLYEKSLYHSRSCGVYLLPA